MEYKVVKAGPDDLNKIYALFLRTNIDNVEKGNLMWSHGYPNIDDFKDDLDLGNLYMILDGEIPVASLGVYLDPIDYFFFKSKDGNKLRKMQTLLALEIDGKCLILERLMVDPSYRGKGLARKIMDSIYELYPGYDQLGAVFYENNHLKPLYEKLGFKIVDSYTDWEWRNPERFYLIGRPHKN